MDLMQLLQSQLSGPALQQISQQIGASEEQTAIASNGIFAALLGGLANNTTSSDGISSLVSALDKDHDGSIMDDLAGYVGGMLSGSASPALNGSGILGHILGSKQEQVAQHVSQSSGLDLSQIMKLMPILAPIVMGAIGKMRNNANGGQGMGLSDLASILMGSAQSAQQGGFGDLIGNVLGGVLGNSGPTPQSGGGLLGKIFGAVFKR